MAIIASDRLYSWAGQVGVPGGIDQYANRPIATTINLGGGGITNYWPTIAGSINTCPQNAIVKLGAGTFPLISSDATARIQHSNFTLRGSGIQGSAGGGTILRIDGGNQAFYIGQGDYPNGFGGYPYDQGAQVISSGANVGSSTFTIPNTTNFAVGKLCHISQTNPTYVKGNDGDRCMIIMFMVIGKTPTTVTVNHAMPMSFTNTPWLVPYFNAPTVGVGFEDMTIHCGSARQALYVEQMYGCWFKNVEVRYAHHKEFVFPVSANCEIRHCTFRDKISDLFNQAREQEGMDFYIRNCWNLVEDNIFSNGGFAQITIGDSRGGCWGNVISYNYLEKTGTSGTGIFGGSINFGHGGHNAFNLLEGNVTDSGILCDGYWGSVSHSTALRNWSAARVYHVDEPSPGFSYDCNSNLIGINLGRWSNYMNVVGNIIGDPAFPIDATGAYSTEINGHSGGLRLIYRLGYPYLGANDYSSTQGPTNPPNYTGGVNQVPPNQTLGEPLDLNVKTTIKRGGNYDYFNKTIKWEDGTVAEAIPNSYFYSGTPNWWPAGFTWPPVNPSSPPGIFNNTTIQILPAAYRWINGDGPPPPPHAEIAVSPPSMDFGAIENNTTKDMTASVTNSGDAGPLVGTASATSPFSIFSGGSYSLGIGQSQDVVIRYAPTVTGTNNATVSFTGGTSGASISVTGTALGAPLGLTFAADAGTISLPFTVDGSHHVSQTVVTADPATGGRAAYLFTAPAGDYRIVINVNAVDDGANSCFVAIDAEPTTLDEWDIQLFTTGYEDRTVSIKGTGTPNAPQFPNKVWTLTAANHTLIIRGREADFAFGTITITPVVAPPPPPAPATNPMPIDGATGVVITQDLSWTAGAGTSTHDLKFGLVGQQLNQLASGLTSPFYALPTMANNLSYQWQVIERNAGGATPGPTWTFTTETLQDNDPISFPAPSNDATGVAIDVSLKWSGSGDTFDLYFGTSNPPSLDTAGFTGNAHSFGSPLLNSTQYFWYIVAHRVSGNVTGPIWNFTTVAAATGDEVPRIIYVVPA